MARTETMLMVDTVRKHFENAPDDKNREDLTQLGAEILFETYDEIDLHNAVCPKDEKWPKARRLSVAAITELLLNTREIKALDLCAFDDAGLRAWDTAPVLAVYDPKEGIYRASDASEAILREDIRKIEGNLPLKEQDTVLKNLLTAAPRVCRTLDPDLIPVNNGIFNYKTKELLPFSPDYIYLSKSLVDYVPFPANPVIHNDEDDTDWDIESWMGSLSDDPEIILLLWQVAGACVRPGVPWDKTVIPYSTSGNNGKGTFCQFLRNLSGKAASIPVAEFKRDFALEPLVSASAVISDENGVGLFMDEVANFKAAVTGDPIQLNRKYKAPVTYRFRGLIVQCFNDLPRIKDKSDSMARRLLYVPFEKSFKGVERKYIKQDYLGRKEVLEYALHKVLHMDCYELSEPDASKRVLQEYKLANDPVLDFAAEILPLLAWDLAPFTFLYDLFKAWFKRRNPSGTVIGYRPFLNGLLEIIANGDFGWYCPDKTQRLVPGNRMNAPEPLILDYNLEDWMNPMYKGGNPNMVCRPILKSVYRGILREDPKDPNPGDPEPPDGLPVPGDNTVPPADDNPKPGAPAPSEPAGTPNANASASMPPRAPENGSFEPFADIPASVPTAAINASRAPQSGPQEACAREPASFVRAYGPNGAVSAPASIDDIPGAAQDRPKSPQPDAVAPPGPTTPEQVSRHSKPKGASYGP